MKENPLSKTGPWNDVAVGYEEVTRPFLEKFSQEGLEQLEVTEKTRLLDVACGPGTFSLLAGPRVAAIDALDFSEDMLAVFRSKVAATGATNFRIKHGDGQTLPYGNEQFDIAVSMFGLMFFPDRKRGMREMCRVLVPGGTALISSWAPVALSPAMLALFGALHAMDPTRPAPARDVASLEDPDLFRAELIEAGFVDVRIQAVQQTIDFESPDEFWEMTVRGSAPMLLLVKHLGAQEFERQSAAAKNYLRGEIGSKKALASTAYLAYARKPASVILGHER